MIISAGKGETVTAILGDGTRLVGEYRGEVTVNAVGGDGVEAGRAALIDVWAVDLDKIQAWAFGEHLT